MTNRTDVIIYSLLYIYGGRPLFFIMGNLFFVVKNANAYHITGIGISFISRHFTSFKHIELKVVWHFLQVRHVQA